MSSDHEKLIAFLRTKPLQYMVHLKHLHLYPNDMQVRYADDSDGTAILLSYAPTLTSWDHSSYPEASQIYLPIATTRETAQRVCKWVGEQAARPFVCKFCDGETR